LSTDEADPPILLTKARNDARALRKVVGDKEIADEIVGFHAQQTVEKALKAVLEHRGIDYPYTHDVARLFALLDQSGGAPEDRDDAIALSPWAAEFRYGDVITGSLDRERALAVADTILAWAEDAIAQR
jgi:HEPN domain-containing protein